jgi:hypothetical protein
LGRFGDPISGRWKFDTSLRNSAVRRAFIGKVPFIGIIRMDRPSEMAETKPRSWRWAETTIEIKMGCQ